MDFDVTKAIDTLKGLGAPEVMEVNDVTFLSLPQGSNLQSIKKLLDEYAKRPDRRSGTDRVTDIATLIEWTNRHKDAHSVVFCDADREAPKLLSVIDYHEQGEGDERARFRAFRAAYDFPLDRRWKEWKEIDGQEMNQRDFAAFIEDHVLDLIAPDISTDGTGETTQVKLPQMVQQLLDLAGGRCALPNEVMALSRGLEVTVNDKVVNRVDLQTGQGTILFDSTHVDGAGLKIEVPKLFMIAIPLFERSPDHYRIPVRIRYRTQGGGVAWYPTLFGADEIMDTAIRDAARAVHEQTERPVFFGWPA